MKSAPNKSPYTRGKVRPFQQRRRLLAILLYLKNKGKLGNPLIGYTAKSKILRSALIRSLGLIQGNRVFQGGSKNRKGLNRVSYESKMRSVKNWNNFTY